MHRIRLFLLLSILILLSACKVELYRNLHEHEANEMISILMNHNVDVEKVLGKEGVVTLLVDEADFSRSVSLLRARGYPGTAYNGAEEYLKKEGMVSSPTEEWARVVYARGQEVARTISEIEGVTLARVHIAVAKKSSLVEEVIPPTASVFIKYREDIDVPVFVPQIKHLVANSIEGLLYKNVTILLSPEAVYNDPKSSVMKSMEEIELEKEAQKKKMIFYLRIAIIVIVCITSCLVYVGFFNRFAHLFKGKDKQDAT